VRYLSSRVDDDSATEVWRVIPVHNVSKVASQYGLLQNGVMRGLFGTVGRDTIYVVGLLGVTPLIQDFIYLVEKHELSNLSAGSYASLIG
jgi:hypothetical protein